MAIPQGLAAHRFGFGPKGGRLPDTPPGDDLRGPDTMLQRHPAADTAAVLAQFVVWRQEIRAHEPGTKPAQAVRRKVREQADDWANRNARAELARAVDATDGYRERLVRFWADHFTIRPGNRMERPMGTAYVDDAIRPRIAGKFATMLRAAILHPAMLGFLDQASSVGPSSAFGKRRGAGLNENLARELLELHTLGVEAGYTQKDVRQTALLLTGLAVDRQRGTMFDPRRAEPGAETVLGKRYGSNGEARIEDIHQLLDDLAGHPQTARHLCSKLAVHFVSDTPDPDLVADLVAIWQRTDGNLFRVSQALATHPAANRMPFEKARQPFDFIVAALRALDIPGDTVTGWGDAVLRRVALSPMAEMGQRWQWPNGPDGWEEATGRWITPQALATRIDWAMRMPPRLRDDLPDARAFVDIALAGLDTDDLRGLVGRAERNAEGVGLVLASPLFNRR